TIYDLNNLSEAKVRHQEVEPHRVQFSSNFRKLVGCPSCPNENGKAAVSRRQYHYRLLVPSR
ncbi:MAG: hypothetical protein WA220_04290, partial [Candidatus Nitrosopolaris sp.]